MHVFRMCFIYKCTYIHAYIEHMYIHFLLQECIHVCIPGKKLNGSARKGKQMSGEVTTETAVSKHNL